MLDADPGGIPILFLLIKPSTVVSLIFSLFFAVCYAFASAFGEVIPRLTEDELSENIKAEDKRAQELADLRSDRRYFAHAISSIQIFSLMFMTWTLATPIERIFTDLFVNTSYTVVATNILAILVLILAFFIMSSVATELAKRLATNSGYGFARSAYPLFVLLARLLGPLTRLSYNLSGWLLRKRGINPDDASVVISEEDLITLIEQSSDNEEANQYGQLLLGNVFEFGDKTASECMTHRTDVVAIDILSSFEELMELLVEEKYTRIPVFEEDIDHIIGQVHSRDILLYALEADLDDFNMRSMLREIAYAPESKTISSLFTEMQEQNLHMAVVIDEYGGTAGIITMEDVLEEIVGQIEDEYDEEEDEDIQELDDKTYLVYGGASTDELAEILEINLPDAESDTVAGLVIELLDRIPEEDEKAEVRYVDYVFKVQKMDDKRIEKLIVRFDPQEEDNIS